MQAGFQGSTTLVGPEQTVRFGKALAPLLKAGDTVLLEGEIGAGKSLLSRAIIQDRLAHEGKMEDVPSPTFTLVQVYELESTEIWHCDLYRVRSADEALELGLEDAFQSELCLVEWPDRLGGFAPTDALTISLEAPPIDDNSRRISFHSKNDTWVDRLAPLLETIANA